MYHLLTRNLQTSPSKRCHIADKSTLSLMWPHVVLFVSISVSFFDLIEIHSQIIKGLGHFIKIRDITQIHGQIYRWF